MTGTLRSRQAPTTRENMTDKTGELDMIGVGESAPDFALEDHLGRKVALGDFKGRRHVLLFFYPLDWTPT